MADDFGKEYVTSTVNGMHTGSCFMKTEYPLVRKTKQEVSYLIPSSAKVVPITPQQQVAEPLVAGFCKSLNDSKDIADVQQIVLDFFCVNAIDIYLEKCLQTEAYGQDFKSMYDEMGVSACLHDGQVLIGFFGESEGSVTKRVRSVFMIPNGVKYKKARCSNDSESSLPALDGHESIALKIGKKEYDEIMAKKKQGIIDHLLDADDASKELFLQYYAGLLELDYLDIANKVCVTCCASYIASFVHIFKLSQLEKLQNWSWQNIKRTVKIGHLSKKKPITRSWSKRNSSSKL